MIHISEILSRMFCKHNEVTFLRNVGGDEQMHRYVRGGGLARSEWACNNCGSKIYRTYRV